MDKARTELSSFAWGSRHSVPGTRGLVAVPGVLRALLLHKGVGNPNRYALSIRTEREDDVELKDKGRINENAM
ncbi:hypothetical protein NDU88_005653 [Pleurodeles waltl]|uniref:Uncharacterized protein n=1 Tax=Pleurodeles waltl TaxID=8319 RepID=A0AAV7L398_PLEWA|nr:hypothetical protein NDU88_005653 [Pleurodeles waltl]